ncbi:hypothetical protein [Paraferrimonas sedimenticola]|uniref:Lipoprotein n=1 Tax=Paraferrimonas sedimenticola TaxID=375674 RepID=A0AA37VXP2_9GAMM|nr:hypothetical protein [Paraferrimonas sedimenticola]GLP95365.1 hypothetical protein GCM10007895_06710 [Paraferrimonas sedimenticola]
MKRLILASVVAAVGLSACSSQRSKPAIDTPFESRFSTKVLNNDAKLFTYSMEMFKPTRRITSREEYMRYRPSTESVEALLDQKVTNILNFNRYCREGFTELDRLVLSDYAMVRGECNEAATEEDRKRFPNIKKARR